MDYAALKLIHMSAAAVSICGFLARGAGVFARAAWVRHRLTRVLPHLVDTILLLSALGMLWVARLSPWALPWLRAKIIGLVVYVVLGVIALRIGRQARGARVRTLGVLAFIAAIVVFAYIVSVAVTKDPRYPIRISGTPVPACPLV